MFKTTRTFGSMILFGILVLLLAACTAPAAPAVTEPGAEEGTTAEGTTEETADGEAAAPAEEIRIGLVTDVGRVNDRSFNQSAWEGVENAAETLGLGEDDYRYIETQAATDYTDNINQFINADFNVIVTVGFALAEATIEAAEDNPDTFFIGVDQFQEESMPNVVGLVFNEDQSGFLAGALAGHLTESDTIAAVLGTDLVPPVVAYKEGYEAGARHVNDEVEIVSSYHPGELSQAFTDPEWGAATARQAIDQGADVVFGAGGQTGNGALQEVAATEGLYCIGVDSDQWLTLPAAHPCLVSSAMKLITPATEELIVNATEGDFEGGNFFGEVGLAPFHDFEDEISQDVKDSLAEIEAGLEDGSISTGYSP